MKQNHQPLQEQNEQPAYLDLVDWVRAHAPTLVALGTIATVVGIIAGFDVSLPRSVQVAGLAALLGGIPLGLLTGSKVVDWLYNPQYEWLIDLDARVLDGGIYRLPPEDFRDLEILDDDEFKNPSYDITQLGPHLYVGKQVDLEDLTVVGTWRGTLDDRELATALRAVYDCRGELQDDAREGFILKSSAWIIVRRATQNTVESVIDLFEDGTLPDSGDALDGVIEKELREFGLDPGGSSLDDLVDDEEIDDLDHKSGFDFGAPEQPDRNGNADRVEVTADD